MLIKGISLIQNGSQVKDRDILIQGNRITKIGRDLEDEEVIDGHGMLAIPGLVNAHTHLAMTLLRGYADDMELMPWLLEKIWPLEAKLTPEDIRWGVRLGCLELIRFGVTCYCDMYYYADECASTTSEMGLRALVSGVLFDMRPDLKSDVEPFLKRWKNDDLIIPAVGPHAIYTCSKETLLWAKDLAEKYDSIVHIHLSETQNEVDDCVSTRSQTPVEYLNSLGMLNSHLLAAHCVHLSPKDISLLSKTGSNVVHCPVSNLKLASGIAPVEAMNTAGVNVCLGTDGACSNNNLNVFEEMKVAAIVQKCATNRPTALPADTVWRMATANSYKALGFNAGLVEGGLADLALIDLRKPNLCPETNMTSLMVYSMAGEVDTTIVNGRVLMRHGVIPGEDEILRGAQRQFQDLLDRAS